MRYKEAILREKRSENAREKLKKKKTIERNGPNIEIHKFKKFAIASSYL